MFINRQGTLGYIHGWNLYGVQASKHEFVWLVVGPLHVGVFKNSIGLWLPVIGWW
jgi:hypothetical protein